MASPLLVLGTKLYSVLTVLSLSVPLLRPWVYMGLSPKPQCQEPRTRWRTAEMPRLQTQALQSWAESSSVSGHVLTRGSGDREQYSQILAPASLPKP